MNETQKNYNKVVADAATQLDFASFMVSQQQAVFARQHQAWRDHVKDSVLEIVKLCKHKKLDVSAICYLAWDICEMSKTTPSYINTLGTVDMTRNVCTIFEDLAAFCCRDIEQKDIPAISIHAKNVVKYIVV